MAANNGNPISSTRNSASQNKPTRRRMEIGNGSCASACCGLNNNKPTPPAMAMTPTCPQADGTSNTRQVAAAMRVMRGTSGQRLRAIPHTACATTATATTFKPCSTPAGSASPQLARPSANRIRKIADGSVNPAHAANAPA